MGSWGSARLYLALCLLTLAPFLRGLFFPIDQLPFMVIILGLMAAVVLTLPRERTEQLVALDYAVLALAVLYLVSSSWAVNPRAALQEGLKQASYVAMYWVVSRSIRNARDRTLVFQIVGGLTVVVAISSILFAAGWIPYDGALWDKTRLGGPFQYPNALAGYLLVGCGVIIALRASAADVGRKLLWGLALYANGIVFIFTYSRIGWLVAPVVPLGALLLAPKGQRLALITAVIPAAAGLAAVILPIDGALKTGNLGLLPLWFAAGLFVASAVELVLHIAHSSAWVRRVAVAVGGLGAVGALVVLLPRTTLLVNRFAAISVGESSAALRFEAYKNSIDAWRSLSPVLGLGGAGWQSVYLGYRSVEYVFNLVHSSVIETLTEVGVQGVLLLVSIWVMAFVMAWSGRRQESSESGRALWAGASAGLAGLLLHSLFDIDLSFPAVTLLVYALIGLFRTAGPTSVAAQEKSASQPWLRYGGAVLFTLLAAGVIPLAVAARSEVTGRRFVEQANAEGAKAAFARAVQYDPLDATFRATYGQFLYQTSIRKKDAHGIAEGRQMLEQAVKLDPRNPDQRLLLADYYNSVGKQATALEWAEKALALDPATRATYEKVLEQAFNNLTSSLSSGNLADAKQNLAHMKDVLERFEKFRKQQPEITGGYVLYWDSHLQFYLALYYLHSGQLDEARNALEHLTGDKDTPVQTQATLWLAVVERQSGRASQAEAAEQKLQSLNPAMLQQVPLGLENLKRALATR